MSRPIIAFFYFFLVPLMGFAQHCPWDCSGMIMLKTPVSKKMVYKMDPVLVDATQTIISDTVFGTEKPTYDRCGFLYYDDFTKYRADRTAIHQWYQYDTVYHFAASSYVVKYNFCKYRDQKLYLRYTDPYSGTALYHYVEIPRDIRIHLHDYSRQLFDRRTEDIKNNLKSSVLVLDCDDWRLRKDDCER